MPTKFIQRLKRIDQLISSKATGTPAQFAQKLDIRESTLYEILKILKDLGAPIEYDYHRCSYFYTEAGRIEIKFTRENS